MRRLQGAPRRRGGAGLRFKAWQPASAIHPVLRVDAPLTFDIFDAWSGRSIGGCRYHVAVSRRDGSHTVEVTRQSADAPDGSVGPAVHWERLA